MSEQPKEYIIYDYELAQWQTITPMSPCCQEIRANVRSRPYPAPALETTSTNGDLLSGFIASINCGNCDEWDAAVDELTRMVYFKTKRMDIRSMVAEAAFSVRQDQNWMQKHDAAIARKAREDVLNELDELLIDIRQRSACGLETPQLAMRRIVKKLESLRGGDP